jgi:hypothetical protein
MTFFYTIFKLGAFKFWAKSRPDFSISFRISLTVVFSNYQINRYNGEAFSVEQGNVSLL